MSLRYPEGIDGEIMRAIRKQLDECRRDDPQFLEGVARRVKQDARILDRLAASDKPRGRSS